MARSKATDAELEFIYRPRSPAQVEAEEMWRRSRILFFVGPAGVGKTTSAMGMAIRDALQAVKKETQNRVKLWLARPHVACDEDLGFLPGDLSEKLKPWLSPFYDCFESLSNAQWVTLEKTLKVEPVSVGLLRGRTIRNGTLIIDEAQQLTAPQIKSALTRLGENSKIVLCGDPDQSDRFDPKKSPMMDAAKKLQSLDTVAVVKFPAAYQLRDPLINEILDRL